VEEEEGGGTQNRGQGPPVPEEWVPGPGGHWRGHLLHGAPTSASVNWMEGKGTSGYAYCRLQINHWLPSYVI
jgi:hypothetical protein